MDRMKTFFIYAIIVVAFYFLSNLLIYLFINGSYKDITGKVTVNNIDILEAKATYVNGYIDGKIKNNTQEEITNKYVKIDIYSERNVCLGTKYVEIEKLSANETMDFHIGYKLKDSDRYEISIVDNKIDIEEEQLISDELAWYAIATTLIVLMFV